MENIQDAVIETVETNGTAIAVQTQEPTPQVQTIFIRPKAQPRPESPKDTPSVIGKVFWKQVPGFREISEAAGYSVVDAFHESGLDWETQKSPMFLADGTPIEDHYAIQRRDNKKVLGYCGNNWKPISNASKFASLSPWLKNHAARIVGVGEINYGEMVTVVLSLNKDMMTVRAGDDLGAFMVITDYSDGRQGAKVNLFTLRLVCTNGMTQKASLQKRQIKHSRHGETNFAGQVSELSGVYAQYLENGEKMKALAGKPINGVQLLEYVKETLPLKTETDKETSKEYLITRSQNVFDDIRSRFESTRYGLGKGTAYDALQAVLEYRNHEQGRSRVTRLDSLLHGPNALASANDLDVAVRMFA